MNQGGLKHAATESRLDTKRERRRGASGRAAALRRAPSDSDCSGETASLSADSGDRAVRPPPPPVRAAKSRSLSLNRIHTWGGYINCSAVLCHPMRAAKLRRLVYSTNNLHGDSMLTCTAVDKYCSRRRGSEWEVLEGLKDGQRFEKRPDVFNGYLHKKRKWPLKGWHKRFFVVDGGILVYARSPTDVARGRLHGSVDVGLSVISAKARRRRIDIDADEFIYHLRAKTADVFRTWLNVLKAHRLYRQHLLTFGARESAPKIHAPLEDLPPTDTSSRTSKMSLETGDTSSEDFHEPTFQKPNQFKSKNLGDKTQSPNFGWNLLNKENKLIYFNVNKTKNIVHSGMPITNKSLCSMNYVTKLTPDNLSLNSPQDISQVSTNTEQQILITDLESSSLRKDSINKSDDDQYHRFVIGEPKADKGFKNKLELNLFPSKTRDLMEPSQSLMKKSQKSTNLVKYKNVHREPTLKKPISKCLLLKTYRSSKCKKIKCATKEVECDAIPKEEIEVQSSIHSNNKGHESLQNLSPISQYDKITEKIMISIFEKQKTDHKACPKDIKYFIEQLVKELYDAKFTKSETHPVIALFRSLLEYWFKNTNEQPFKEAARRVKSVGRPSNNYFTRDKMLSSYVLSHATKQTQFHGISDFIGDLNNSVTNFFKGFSKNKNKRVIRCHSPKRDTESFEKERRIQERESVLKNVVYICETVRSNRSKEHDIMITKNLIKNLEKISNKAVLDHNNEQKANNSNSSTELPKIQDTINHLINDMAVPANVAKDLLNAYLGLLIDSSKSVTSSSQSSEICIKDKEPECDVAAEPVQKRMSKSVVTVNLEDHPNSSSYQDPTIKQKPEMDPGAFYLKEVLDKITTIFTKVSNKNKQVTEDSEGCKGDKLSKIDKQIGRKFSDYNGQNFVSQNPKDNSLVIKLSKYDLEHVSISNESKHEGKMSIIIQLKEKPLNYVESNTRQLSLKFYNERLKSQLSASDDGWVKNLENSPAIKVTDPIGINFKPSCDIERLPDVIELRPYTSTSEVTSKAYCKIVQESEHSIDISFNSSKFFKKDFLEDNDDAQSCYIISSLKKKSLTSKLQPKRKVRLKPSDILPINNDICMKSSKQSCSTKYPEEYTIFEQATPNIIDEKFILLLLENLTLLSKNIPSLYKDLYTLYIKLKKKHDKVVRNCNNIQGLSLLGRIYNDDDKPNNRETQYEEQECNITSKVQQYRDAAINTGLSNMAHKSVNTYNLLYDTKLSEVQTECTSKLLLKELQNCLHISTSKRNFSKNSLILMKITKDKEVVEQGTKSKFPSHRPQKECEISTVIKTVFDNSNNIRPLSIQSKNLENVHVLKIDKNFLDNKKSNLKETRHLAPNIRTSTLTQTDKTVNNHFIKDYNVYHCDLGKKKLRKSVSCVKSSTLSSISDDLKTIYRCSSEPSYCSGLVSPTSPTQRGPQAGFVSGTPGGRFAGWIIESGGPLENASRELGQAQLSVQQLQRLLEALELQHQVHHDTDVSLEGASPNVKKDRRKFGLRKKKSNSKCASVELAPPQIDPSSSHMALSTLTAPPSPGGGASSMPNSAASLPIACAAARPQSLPGAESLGGAGGPASITSLTPDHQLREDFTVLAKDLVTNLKSIVSTLVIERGRLRAAVEAAESSSPGAMLAALRTNLSTALHQNNDHPLAPLPPGNRPPLRAAHVTPIMNGEVFHTELRSRLSRIHDASDIAEMSSIGPNSDPQPNRQFQQSLSYSSSCVSASEFFDAEEHDDDFKPAEIIAADEAGVIELDGDSSSEAGSLSSEEGSASSDNSEAAMLSAEQVNLRLNQNGVDRENCWTRRTCLPSPRPTPGGPSLWNLLYKNIGKDLSQISMPVTINEPLNMLQRLCEELEYSELLDAAAECKSAVERMALIAAFAVSAYASSAHRAASKPFNPLLAETYECVRDDKGFRFIAEQVSHHPPISACHAESSRWYFWQEARIKTKFWGKSMEFQPAGRVHVRLTTTGDHYSWNKVTTCVHNLFGGQRWVDQYGDMHITCHGTDITCKLNFIKASSWSSSRHEVRGAIYGGGGARLRLQGRWSEALYAGEPPAARCLWRPGAMPPEHELYYGFTRFAMELNEMEPGMQNVLPHTDTRFRPDQRALEMGDVEEAEQYKHSLEQAQRERRRDCPAHQPAWFRKAVEEGEETWVFTGEYWKAREASFPAHAAPRIW